MKFKDRDHKDFYIQNVDKTKSVNDPFRKALFYTLGLTEQTRTHIKDLYNFEERGIDFNGLKRPWQTGTSTRVTRLAFNIYNGFCGDIGEEVMDGSSNYTPYNLFDTGLMTYMFEAIKLLYPCYADSE